MAKSKWVVGDIPNGMFFVVCEECAGKEAPQSDTWENAEDFFGEVDSELHPKCESHECEVVFD